MNDILVLCKVSLKVAGDIESNPPLFLKSVQVSFSQGNVGMLAENAGRQCECSALFSIFWSLIKKISCCTTQSLGHILI